MSEPEEHPFWDNQPVAKTNEDSPHQIELIDANKVPSESVPVPGFLVFGDVSISEPVTLAELHDFLADNYVGSSDGTSRFAYSCDFLQWWIGSQQQNLSIGLRAIACEKLDEINKETENKLLEKGKSSDVIEKAVIKPGQICGYISGLPMEYSYNGLKTMSQSVDFLCVHMALRSLNLAPALIEEITRRSYKNHVYTAIFTCAFTARQKIPAIPPVLTSTYWHRLLEPIKLSQCGFCRIPYGISQKDYVELYRLPIKDQRLIKNFRKMVSKDVGECEKLVVDRQKSFVIGEMYSKKLFEKLFKCRDGVIQSFCYVVDGAILGFISYYIVDSRMLDQQISKLHSYVRNGYILEYAVKDGQSSITVEELVMLCIHEMYDAKIDVCTCLDICKNDSFIKTLKFDAGDGKLCYHTFNMDWGKPGLEKRELGVVLV